MDFFGFATCRLGEGFAFVGIDDAARGVYQQAAMVVHAILGNLLQAAALGSNAGNQQEVFGGDAAHVGEEFALRGTHDKHQLVVGGPGLGDAQHLLKEAFALCVGSELEVLRPLVRGQSQHDDPVSLVVEERFHAIFSHVGSHRYGVDVEMLEEAACIHLRGIAYVAAFGVGDDELVGIVFLDVTDGFLKGFPPFEAEALIEGEVGFVGHTQVGRGVDDGFVEGEDGVFFLQEMLRYLLDVGIETYAEKRFLAADILKKLLFVHFRLGLEHITFHFLSDVRHSQPR